MYDEEEDFFNGNVEDGGSEHDRRWVGPDVGADEVGVPGDGGGDGDGGEEGEFVVVEARAEGVVEEGEEEGGGECVG